VARTSDGDKAAASCYLWRESTIPPAGNWSAKDKPRSEDFEVPHSTTS
jgi:hypothetical protein